MKYLLSIATLFVIAALIAAQDEGFTSGPKKGAVLPGPFDSFNVNGKYGKGRQHCLVCEYGLNPVVMIFAPEPAEDKGETLTKLLAKLDAIVEREKEKSYFSSFVVFLHPDAKNSANTKTEEPDELVKEAKARDDLMKRLADRAEKLKSLVVACLPEAPKSYTINPKAEVTVLFYNRHKVLATWAFEDGKFADEHVDAIVKTVESVITTAKPATKK